MLGSPQNSGVTIHLLNSILIDQLGIAHVEILNPLLAKETGWQTPENASYLTSRQRLDVSCFRRTLTILQRTAPGAAMGV